MSRRGPLSAETKAKISAAKKGKPLSPEHRARSVAHLAAIRADPEVQVRHAAACADPMSRAKVSAARAGTTLTPEWRANIGAASKVVWSDPARRAEKAEAMKKWWGDPSNREKIAAIHRANWANPEYRAKVVAACADQESPAWVAPWIERRVLVPTLRERDGDLCQLCLEPIDFDLEHPHPEYVNVDHIRPVAAGGTEDPANLWLAHGSCNRKKCALYVGRADGTTDPRRSK